MSSEIENIGFEPNDFSSKEEISSQCDVIINYSRNNYPRYDLSYFSDVHSLETINSDTETIQQIKGNFTKKNSKLDPKSLEKLTHSKKRSEALEIIIADQIESSDWFGSDSLFFRTTEYDDLVNGVDAVVEFNIGDYNNPERLALSIDSTSRTDSHTIEQKIDRNISKLFSNKLEVKYFESPNIDTDQIYKGVLKDVVPVVIGLEASNTNNLISLFSRLIKLDKSANDTSLSNNQRTSFKKELIQTRRKIEKDPTQLIFLREIELQLEMYTLTLTKENNPNINIKVSNIQKLSEIIRNVIDEKDSLDDKPEMKLLEKDTVYNLVGYHCQKRAI